MSSEEDNRQEKNKESISDVLVHSANSWETADLGNKQRNDKFLRLMGASKKEHHGKIIIGDKKPAPKIRKEEKHRAEELEEQYEHSMEHRLVGGRKGHLGLGYHLDKQVEEKREFIEEEVEVKEEESEENILPGQAYTENNESTTDGKESVSRTHIDQNEGHRKRENLNKSPESDIKKMKFVKSSH